MYMRKTNYIIKFLVVITISLFFSRLLFGQKSLDHKLFLENIKHSSDNFYKECLKEYDTYLEKYPDDVSVLIEKCKFIQNAQYDENEEINPNQEHKLLSHSYINIFILNENALFVL